jgi:uncharacterized hydrophobic protein (TIGR00341 family)
MALRLVEVIFQREDLQRFSHLTEEVPVVSIWTVGSNDTRSLVRILLDSKHTETLSDILMKEFGSRDEFRLISLPVEATLPIIEEEAKEKKEVQEPNPVKGESDRISREELYEDIAQGAKLTRVYVATVALSTIVAAVGLVRDDIAIVIGAMVIAPLLGPNVSLSLAATLGDLDLARRSLTTIGVGVATALALSFLIGIAFHVDPHVSAIHARTHAGLSDVAIALAAGAAGSLAFTTGVPAAVVGVMVSVALLPPLVVMGLMLGSGQSMLAFGSSMLLLTNITCINLAAVATFLVQRVRPRTWWEAERAKSATRIALAIWIVMFAILLGLILLGQIGAV